MRYNDILEENNQKINEKEEEDYGKEEDHQFHLFLENFTNILWYKYSQGLNLKWPINNFLFWVDKQILLE